MKYLIFSYCVQCTLFNEFHIYFHEISQSFAIFLRYFDRNRTAKLAAILQYNQDHTEMRLLMGDANRDKHWVQLLFDSGSSSPGAFFSSSGSGPGGSGSWHTDRDKHWVQLLFDM